MKTTTRFLTTGQAAKQCSVTPDTVLKWIRSGLLPAHRTAGGHHRVDARELERLIKVHEPPPTPSPAAPSEKPFRYCWEFKGEGKLPEGCRECAAYQLRAQRCYEVERIAPNASHLKLFCSESCDECDYYRNVHKQDINVLVVTGDKKLIKALKADADKYPINLAFGDCEYTCSAIIHDFRPDYAIIDCALGPRLSRDLCRHLSQDPRVPFIRIIQAANEGEFPTSCDREVFARIQRPFSIRNIAECATEMLKGISSSN